MEHQYRFKFLLRGLLALALLATVPDVAGQLPGTPYIICDLPAVPSAITFSATCGHVGNTFTASVENVGDVTYTWTLPTGLTGSSTTNSIEITRSAAGIYAAGTITVAASNACGTSATKSSESDIRVFSTNTTSTETVLGNNGTYNVYCYPDNVGCWMIDNSKEEGVDERGRDIIMARQYRNRNGTEVHGDGERGYYYSMHGAPFACPNGFSLPKIIGDSRSYPELNTYLTCPDTPQEQIDVWLNPDGMAGSISDRDGYGSGWGEYFYMRMGWDEEWLEDEENYILNPLFDIPMWYSNNPSAVRTNFVMSESRGYSVRCVKTN
jgi:hypothetical protein